MTKMDRMNERFPYSVRIATVLLIFAFAVLLPSKAKAYAPFDIVTGGQPRAVVLIPEPSGSANTVPGWSPTASNNGRITLSGARKHSGSYSLRIDDYDSKSYSMQSDYVGYREGRTTR